VTSSTFVLSDVPDSEDDFVNGVYELEQASPKATVAVKLVDMLGEELLVTKPA